jgi:hypothetical protein
VELEARFRAFAAEAVRAPLYQRLAAAVADEPDVLEVLRHASAPQQLPVLLFASVHHLLLGGSGPHLAAHYPNLAAAPVVGDPAPLFVQCVGVPATELERLVATRSTQTNEVGRCAQLLPALGLVADEVGALAHVDVGTSAGLNLLLSRYCYDYRPGGQLGDPSPVQLVCATRGAVPVPARLPEIRASIGLERTPVDLHDPEEVRWLEACVWPDQADRFARLVAALELASHHPPDVRRGDAVDDLADTVRAAAAHGHPVVTNSWVLNYLEPHRRLEYVAQLDRLGDEFDLSWVIAEAPDQTAGLPVPTTDPAESITVLSLVTWRNGQRTVRRLGTTHPHGYWLHWEA